MGYRMNLRILLNKYKCNVVIYSQDPYIKKWMRVGGTVVKDEFAP